MLFDVQSQVLELGASANVEVLARPEPALTRALAAKYSLSAIFDRGGSARDPPPL